MASRKPPQPPYQLTEAGGLVCARGPQRAYQELMRLPSAKWWPGSGGFVSFEPSRDSLLCAEAAADIDWCSDGYTALRSRMMAPTADQMALLHELCPPLARPLLPHQVEWVARALGCRGGLNASDRGTGKTAPAWVASRAWRSHTTFIACPKAMMDEWASESVKTLAPQARVPVVELSDGMTVAERGYALAALSDEPGPLAVVANYDVLDELRKPIIRFLSARAKHGAGPSTAKFDESWRIKSPKAAVSKAAHAIADCADYVVAMTGTLWGNDVGDAWSQLRLLMAYSMQWFPDYDRWMSSYATYATIEVGERKFTKPVGCKDPVGIISAMAPYYYRAPKACCVRLPPPEHEYVAGAPTEQQLAWYRRLRDDGEACLGDGTSLAGERVVKLRLQQVLGGHLAAPTGQQLEQGCRVAALPSWKLEWAREWARARLLGDRRARAIVWCKFNCEVATVTAALRELLGNELVVPVTGPTDNQTIREIKAEFNARDEERTQVVVAQVKKLFAGHNMQAGDYHVWFSEPWSFIEYEQACDRSNRLGREGDGVKFWHLVTGKIDGRASVDMDVRSALEQKLALSDMLSPDTVATAFEEL